MHPEPTPVYLDCDTGIDDALALGHLLASPRADLVGVGCVHGNIDVDAAVENTRRLVTLAGRGDIPVAPGASAPLVGEFAGGAPHVHGVDGIGGVRESLPSPTAVPVDGDAVDLLLRLSREHVGELQLLAIGPLTNLAHALDRDPGLVDRVAGVTVMGGAARVPGNVHPVAEANIWHDPEAAQVVVAAPWPVTLVPLDTTMEHTLDERHRQRLCDSASAYARACGEMLDRYLDFYGEVVLGRRAAALHDPLAAAVMLGEVNRVRSPRVPVEVDCSRGPGRGQTICDLRSQRRLVGDVDGANVRVVLETAPGYVDLLLDLLEQV
ncbi:nucleoside hydrolase [Corynebacterium terpenotabidum]|uniref:Inosine-uridine preferring nucleoside hydrolase n=1 Tax=Corynebacterium terpenotabidum Y-11 TaxID=1200352 RepID=S4XD04_9CORY|nr:nucleoside hydrolase [Corynebacterium terpenotabidum]AGP30429.1 inosine-uridine preferring nucleoside hydrolase [Corynebacterium terpenotabidum Y-11]